MKYEVLWDMYRASIANTWTVDEVDLSGDIKDLRSDKFTESQTHLIKRLVAFFATGDTIVANNLVLSLYKHVNTPEGRMYLSRQLAEEALHIEFYLTLLDTYIPDHKEREEMFDAVENIPSIRRKAEFMQKWMNSVEQLDQTDTDEKKRQFLLNMVCFACCVEGLFFFAAFAYVYFLRSKGLLDGLASGTNWVFRDESMHMEFAFTVIDITRKERPDLFTKELETQIREMLAEAIAVETEFAEDLLSLGVAGLTKSDMTQYLRYCADQRLTRLGYTVEYGAENPFEFMELQDIQELTNFFERRVSAYQVAVQGDVTFDEEF